MSLEESLFSDFKCKQPETEMTEFSGLLFKFPMYWHGLEPGEFGKASKNDKLVVVFSPSGNVMMNCGMFFRGSKLSFSSRSNLNEGSLSFSYKHINIL